MRYIDFVVGEEPQSMSLCETTKPIASGSEVLVEIKSFGVNRADTLQRKGFYPAPDGESLILGLEVAGIVVATGPDADKWQIGDCVFGLVAGGGYAEFVAVEQSHLMIMPANLTFDQAAAIAEVFLTAYQALFELGGLQVKQRVLIHAGASGVGLAAIQMAAQNNCLVATTSSDDKKLKVCAKYGAELCVNYKEETFAHAVKDKLGRVDVIVDVVGGEYLNENLRLLNLDGTVVQLAMLGGRYTKQFDMGLMLSRRATIKASTLRNRSDAYKTSLINDFSLQFLPCFDTKTIVPVIDTVFSVDQIALAHERLERNDSIGKFVVSW